MDSGAGLVLSIVCFSLNIEQQKQVYNCKANDVSLVYNEQTNHVFNGACQQIVDMVKQLLNYVWLAAEVTV